MTSGGSRDSSSPNLCVANSTRDSPSVTCTWLRCSVAHHSRAGDRIDSGRVAVSNRPCGLAIDCDRHCRRSSWHAYPWPLPDAHTGHYVWATGSAVAHLELMHPGRRAVSRRFGRVRARRRPVAVAGPDRSGWALQHRLGMDSGETLAVQRDAVGVRRFVISDGGHNSATAYDAYSEKRIVDPSDFSRAAGTYCPMTPAHRISTADANGVAAPFTHG